MEDPLKSTEKKRKLRFTCLDDINLLKETVGINPYENVKKWQIVLQNFNNICKKNFTLRAIKDHVEHLLDLFKKEEIAILRKSGTEKMYEEKEALLQEILDLKMEYAVKKERKKIKNEQMDEILSSIEIIPEVIYDEDEVSLESSPDSDNRPSISPSFSNMAPRTATKRSSQKNSLLEMLKEKKETELLLEEKKLKLEEKRLEYDNRRLNLEEAKFVHLREMQQQQQQMFAILINKLTK